MDKGLIVAIIAAVVAIVAFVYARSLQPPTATTATLSMGQALGAGILGLGILLLAMPWAAGEISQLGFITSSDFGILSGSVYAIGILALLGGLAILIARNAPEA
jgi:hypothetical protein